MLEDITKNTHNLLRKEIIVPDSNRYELPNPIVPERFSSTTSPVHGSIMPTEYNSITERKYK